MDSSYEMMTGYKDFDMAPLQDHASEVALLTVCGQLALSPNHGPAPGTATC